MSSGCNLSHCHELATQVAHVAKLVNIELSLQPLGNRGVDVEVEHILVPRLEAELAVKGDADPAHLGAVAVATIVQQSDTLLEQFRCALANDGARRSADRRSLGA